jgi:hypothetical protein
MMMGSIWLQQAIQLSITEKAMKISTDHNTVEWWAFVICNEPDERIHKTQYMFRVFTKCTHTCNERMTHQVQYTQLTAVAYHHADSSISYTEA